MQNNLLVINHIFFNTTLFKYLIWHTNHPFKVCNSYGFIIHRNMQYHPKFYDISSFQNEILVFSSSSHVRAWKSILCRTINKKLDRMKNQQLFSNPQRGDTIPTTLRTRDGQMNVGSHALPGADTHKWKALWSRVPWDRKIWL